MNKTLCHWRFSFFLIPSISIGLIYGLYKTLYLLLTYDIFPFRLSTHTTIQLIAILSAFLIPLIISRIYETKLLIPLFIWASCTILALILDKGVYEGNPNSGFALDLLPYQLLAIIITIGLIILIKRGPTSLQS